MNLKARFNRVADWGKQNSPDILLVTGLVEGAVGVFLACRATLKAKKIMDEPSEDKVYNNNDGTYVVTVPARKKLAKAIDICRVYAVPAALLTASGASICAGHGILKTRYTGALTAYSALTASFIEYRERVRSEVGAEKEEELYYGTEKETISVKIEQEDGSTKTVRKKFDIRKENGLSPYAQKFDPMKACGTTVPYYVDSFIQREESYLDDQLKADGHLYLNPARRRFYLEEDDAGQLVGWIFDPRKIKDGERDNYVKVIKKEIFVKDENDQWTSEIWIDFNVDGVIFGKMSKEEYKGINEIGDQGLKFSNKEA